MFAKVLSLLGALVITGATVLVAAEPAHAHPSGGYHHGGHYGRYYGGHDRRHHDGYYGGYRHRPYYGGYRYPYRPYYGYDPNDYLRR